MHKVATKFILIYLFFGWCLHAYTLDSLTKYPNSEQLKKIEKGHILSYSEVTSESDLQVLKLFLFGLHPKKCRIALSKISQYENYKEFLGLVTESRYENGKIYLELSHALLPFDMTMNFKMERVKKPGKYTFTFDQGFLKGLIGDVTIKEESSRCLFMGRTYWKGKSTGFPDSIFSFFSKQLTKMAMSSLFKISRTY
ncbi:hypothetical protein OAT67_01240 [Bacteriovoracaceae bacterium]|nr:hypothetical protein [Bacteriovoracaceae bacterium]